MCDCCQKPDTTQLLPEKKKNQISLSLTSSVRVVFQQLSGKHTFLMQGEVRGKPLKQMYTGIKGPCLNFSGWRKRTKGQGREAESTELESAMPFGPTGQKSSRVQQIVPGPEHWIQEFWDFSRFRWAGQKCNFKLSPSRWIFWLSIFAFETGSHYVV
jgi:hypothetical protein